MALWDDQQYLQFSNERTRPAVELLARVPLKDARVVVDLGCGPGNSTRLLIERWPHARVIGVDSSSEMLERAREDLPAGEWVCSDALSYRAESPPNLVFSNALLHWLPDHATVFPALLEQLPPGGVLAVQMPQNFAAPSHRLMRELAGPWQARLRDVRAASPVHAPEFYYDLLASRAQRLDIWQTTYAHVMPDVASIVEWVKGTGIRPYLAALSAAEQAEYLAAYACGLDAAYPARADGKRLFYFSRIFIVATR
jgi:trans-aconitate 2-methyltransferase